MLELADNIFEFAQAVTWLPHGRAFRIHNKDKFMQDVVPFFFNQTKIRSFNRQLHMWGFRRSGRGDDQVWSHDNFLRGKPEDMKLMVRTKIKGNTGGSSEDMRLPNFDVLPPLPVCDKQPSAILDIMGSVILKLPSTTVAIAHCGSAMSAMSHPQLGNLTADNNCQMMALPRTETPCQFNVNHHQDDALQIPSPPPPFRRSVTDESQFMMQPYVSTMNYLPQQVDRNHIEPSPAEAEHQTSVHGLHRLEESHIHKDNPSDFSLISLRHDEDFEPLSLSFDGDIPCDDFASFIECAIQRIES